MFVCAGSAEAGTVCTGKERARKKERESERESMHWQGSRTIKWSDHGKLQFPWCLALAGQSWLAAGCAYVCVYCNLQGSVKVECEGCWTVNSNVEQLV